PESESLWQGECFVFDNRVSVTHNLDKGNYFQCHACRLPITDIDKQSHKYQQGISCPACYDRKTSRERARFREREKQVQLAKRRGEPHIGSAVCEVNRQRKKLKLAWKNEQRETLR
ncbi:MAG: hypothetical protein O7F15_06775, partial [Gammaproteobacteria bacterium]|nr:hypothetical protein [Gammaproteobacteria bacterium]